MESVHLKWLPWSRASFGPTAQMHRPERIRGKEYQETAEYCSVKLLHEAAARGKSCCSPLWLNVCYSPYSKRRPLRKECSRHQTGKIQKLSAEESVTKERTIYFRAAEALSREGLPQGAYTNTKLTSAFLPVSLMLSSPSLSSHLQIWFLNGV